LLTGATRVNSVRPHRADQPLDGGDYCRQQRDRDQQELMITAMRMRKPHMVTIY
jgi:hypothetical protein